MSIEDRNLKPGTVLVARHKKADYRCTVLAGKEEGKLLYKLEDGREFTSPSAAGSAVMDGTACNGWRWWTPEAEWQAKPAKEKPAPKATTRATAAKKGGASKKATAKPKAKTAEPSTNGTEPHAEKPVGCGDCGQEFPTSREAADHMRDAHTSPEATGAGCR